MAESTTSAIATPVSLTEKELEIARKYDLTGQVSKFLDRHLIYPLIESLDIIYDDQIVNKLVYDLLKDTNMTSFVKEQFSVMNPGQEFPKEILQKEEFVKSEQERLDKETKETLNVLSQKEVQDHLKQDKEYNTRYLAEQHGIDEKKINALYEYAQFQYNCGDYVMASDLLNNFRVLSTNVDKIVSSTWGRLASEIISLQWDNAIKELTKLREVEDSRNFQDPLTQLHNRTWIIHWSLFPFFNTENGLEKLCDLFFSSSYLSAIQAACPWIIRYLVVAVVELSSNKKSQTTYSNYQKRLKDLIKVVGQEQYEYSDPLTDFIKALYIDYDFELAREKLSEASIIIKTDFFLTAGANNFIENARFLIAEVYCRVHQRIELDQLSRYLDLSEDDGEKWIAKLIRSSRMNAKIDESEKTIIMNHTTRSVYQEVMEKTKGLSFKSNQVLVNIIQKQENTA